MHVTVLVVTILPPSFPLIQPFADDIALSVDRRDDEKTKQNPRLCPFSKRLRGAYAMMMTFGYAHNDNLNTRNSICIQVHCFRRTHTFAGLLLLLSPIKVPRIANYLDTTVFLQVVAPFLWLARCCFFFRHNYNVKRRHLHSALYRGLCKFTSNAKRVMMILWVSQSPPPSNNTQ